MSPFLNKLTSADSHDLLNRFFKLSVRLSLSKFLVFFLLVTTASTFSQNGKVIKVKDGDTIVILDIENNQHTVRVADIDCPERGQPFSNNAKAFVSNEIFGKQVEVQKKSIDKYDRIVGYVLYEGKNLSHELIKQGLAWHYKYYSDDKKMAILEQHAKNEKIGLWIDPNPINPYDWRKGEKKAKHN